jgi:hypothetical protein
VLDTINEFRYPPKSVDYNNVKNPDDFWSWSLRSAAEASGVKDFPQNVKTISDLILWLNYAAQAWNKMQHNENILGEKSMNIREVIRKMVRQELTETIKKYKKAKIPAIKIAKDAPKTKVDRDMTKEDEVALNVQANKQDEFMKKDSSGVPTEKQWKRLRNAEEVEASPTIDEINKTWHELTEKIGKELEEMCDISKKIGDKGLCDIFHEISTAHLEIMQENRERYKFIKLQYALRPALAKLKQVKDFSSKDKDADIEKLHKLLEKYLKVEVKKKHEFESERIEDHTKEFNKLQK